MKDAGTVNPVFMLDEIDKLGSDFRGDPAAALLEVLDPEQNFAFTDHYLDVPYDLSRVMFITTANLLDPIPPPLLDRMEVIQLPGYTEEEKLQIARQFLVPKQLDANGLAVEGQPLKGYPAAGGPHKPDIADWRLPTADLQFGEQAIRHLIRFYTYEAGVRNLEREIGSVCRKVARRVAEGRPYPRQVTPNLLGKYLGPPRRAHGVAEQRDEVGVATGLSWTANGGDTMAIEVSVMGGKGTLTLTGQLGDVMRESAQAALSFARANAKRLGIDERRFDKTDIHIHVPEGAVPKDGPSAGITLATALISALAGQAVKRDVALTGEITLRGRVLPVGGIKEKILGAHRAGIRTIILPTKNERDIAEVPGHVKRKLVFIYVEHMDEVIASALREPPTAEDGSPTKRNGKRARAEKLTA
jgi:ATP-dependent Lon protease